MSSRFKHSILAGPVACLGFFIFVMMTFPALNPALQAADPMLSDTPFKSDSSRIYAVYPPHAVEHDAGDLDLQITNMDRIGNPWLDEPSAYWRYGDYLYGAELWIGAIASDNLSYTSTSMELRPTIDVRDRMYYSHEGMTGGNRIGFSSQPDDDNDGLTDEDPLNGWDDDGDGRIDEDYSAVSVQMYSCEFTDYTPEALEQHPDHRPLNVKVSQRSFGWSMAGYDDFVGVEYEILNDGFETLREIYLGIYADCDIGPRDNPEYFADDGGSVMVIDTFFVDSSLDACDTTYVPIEMAYMYDIPDDGVSATGGDQEGFFGVLFLGHSTDPMDEWAPQEARLYTCRFFSTSLPYPEGLPRNDFERYDALQQGGIPIRPTIHPDDYSFLISVGPFTELSPGESIIFQVALVAGHGYYDTDENEPDPSLDSGGLPNEESLLNNALAAREIFEGRWRDVDGLSDTGVDGKETCISPPPGVSYHWNDPCDPEHSIWFEDNSCDEAGSWVDNDCNPCTPNDDHEGCDQGGCEIQVHWYHPLTIASVNATPTAAGLTDILRISPIRNPAIPPLPIEFVLSEQHRCELGIYDVMGRRVRHLASGDRSEGLYQLRWDGKDHLGTSAAPGIYFLRASDGDQILTRQFVLLQP
ncbi:MAG: hypothetical protein KJ970_13710 [Candidatus Eisenbacteria bacterium]|uniref:FlgD/Vpr Ig-like domain-containing protein n=1 Tax=Eiseniibacteriota bacterium TaxID=2212470 RepID=A0A948RWV6_UNCEI|nr:hypothetical protein [Candidatus Eisenbacteria bacterium]MBU1950719.1 hypothetical protein [Candidatus Eisenbacteria bacterium]MBU2691971.1 hypothetical protein [Candidatus Eisenbacteria bacterium]